MTQALKIQIDTPRWSLPLVSANTLTRYLGAHGGRGSGKSWLFAEMIIERCIEKKTNVVCIREVQKSLSQSVKKLLETKIEELGVGSLFEVQESMIKTPYGGVIIFQGMQNHTADSIKSLEGYDIAWIEEAQSLSQKSLDLLRPTMRKVGSQIWATWNPRNADDPIELLLRSDEQPENTIVVEANYRDNPWFPDVLKSEMEYDKRRDPDKYAHIWLGQFEQRSEARVFNNWKVKEFEAPSNAIHSLGADWGFSIDPTTLIRSHEIGRTLYIDYEAYQVGCEINNTPLLFQEVPDSEKWPITADNARPETISYLKKHGYPKIYGAVKGKGSVEEGIEFLKSYDIIVHPRCVHTIDELTMYKYKVDPNTDKVLPILEDKHNHVIDAIRYSKEGQRRANIKPIKSVAPPPTVNHWG